MDKEYKNRSGSQSNASNQSGKASDRKQSHQPGAPNKSNRQTGDHERDESHGADRNTTKKGENAV